ncbi:MAG TPA: hypothetical protein P5079_11925, partial [Elusimicrobiota bacterium]|nr:hypothetical protein [Elusimicrobiota bacterium]
MPTKPKPVVLPPVWLAGVMLSVTTDAFGNETKSYSQQTFIIMANQAKLKTVTSWSVSTGVDGAVTTTDAYTMVYKYWGEELYAGGRLPSLKELKDYAQSLWGKYQVRLGEMMSADQVGVIHSRTEDAFGNVTDAWSTQTFKIINNQAKLETVTSWSTALSIDGTVTKTDAYVMKYTYREDTAENRQLGRVGHLVSAELLGTDMDGDGRFDGRIYSHTKDAFGNVTESWSTQTFVIIANQAKLKEVTSASETKGVDGVVSVTDPYTIRYTYYGEELYANGRVPSRNEIKAWIARNDHRSIFGQLQSAVLLNTIHSRTVDLFGTISNSWSTQTFVIVAGVAKLKEVTTWSKSESFDGSTTTTDPYTIRYNYFGEGLYAGGRMPYREEILAWMKVNGRKFGQLQSAAMLLRYQPPYEGHTVVKNGKVTIVQQPGQKYGMHSVSVDAFGNVSETWTTQNFIIVAGVAKVGTEYSYTLSKSLDMTTTYSYSLVTYKYHEDTWLNRQLHRVGQYKSASGTVWSFSNSLNFDNTTTVTVSVTNNVYKIVAGKPV